MFHFYRAMHFSAKRGIAIACLELRSLAAFEAWLVLYL